MRQVVAVVMADRPLQGPDHLEAEPHEPGVAPPLVRLLAGPRPHVQGHPCISHLLSLIPYEEVPREKVILPKRQKRKGYVEPDYPWRYIREKY